MTDFELFLFTVEEYKRFADSLPVNKTGCLIDNYSESDYVGVQVRLMILRKYYCEGKNQNVSIKNLIEKARKEFPEKSLEVEALSLEYEGIAQQQIQNILSDGTKLNLYTTIEDAVYGLYLHADENRIIRLRKTTESIRFICVRKFVFDLENLIYKMCDFFKKEVLLSFEEGDMTSSPLIYLGNTKDNKQEIKKSPYWKNVYGHDASDEEIRDSIKGNSIEDTQILAISYMFLDYLKEKPLPIENLKWCVFPETLKEWGDFKEAQEFYLGIQNPGVSNVVRYNKNKDTAYVRVFPRVEEAFCVDTPHVFEEVYEIALGKHAGIWKVFSFGGHLDSIFV